MIRKYAPVVDYSWDVYHNTEGYEPHSQDPANPLFVDADNGNFALQYTSPAIDTGVDVGLTTDYAGNPIYGTPDIGAYEYQPPYTIGTHDINDDGSIRIYADGKYRYKEATSGSSIDFSVEPEDGYGTGDYSEYMDVTIDTWQTSGDKNKQWTASSTTAGDTVYTIGDLLPNQHYQFKLDGVNSETITGASCTDGICLADGSGIISFTYTGGYSSHIFNLEYTDITPDPAPTDLDLTAGTDTGSSATDNITSDTTPTFTVSCVNGSTVELFDGVTALSPTAVCVASTVTITIPSESAFADGTHTITARQTDAATNVSDPSSVLTITIDTTPPATPTIYSVAAGATTITGTGEDGSITTLPGIACANEPITVTGGLWNCQNPSPSPTPGQTIVAVSTDTAGNTSTGSHTIPQSGGGRSSITYACRDPDASNYKNYGVSRTSLCKYAKDTSENETTREPDEQGTINDQPPTINEQQFFYPQEQADILTQLQKLHGAQTVTEDVYQNQCITKQGQPYYRTCPLGLTLSTFTLFRDSVVCEGFIVQQTSEEDYRFQDVAPRKEVTGIAVKMKKVAGKHVDLVEPQDYLNIYTDIGLPSQAPWIQPVAETALKYGIVSKQRTTFEPDRDVTRAEAFAMIMNTVCMVSNQTNTDDWRVGILERARQEGLTEKTWETFEPDRSILRQELFLLASKAADWAERTGGCDPKPEYCFLP